MKHILLLIAGIFSMTLSAFDIVSGEKYRIVCNFYPAGSLCLGSEHGVSPRLYHTTEHSDCKDCWWTFTLQPDGTYSIQNALTGAYITYTTERVATSVKGLTVTDSDEGEASHWTLTAVDGTEDFYIHSTCEEALAKNDTYWNQRTDGSGLLGTYAFEGNNPNEVFSLVRQGEEGGGGNEGGGDEGDEKGYTVIDGGEDAIVVTQTGNRLTVIPAEYIEEIVITGRNSITATLIHGQTADFDQVVSYAHNDYPANENIPMFVGYKFNNKYNPQIMVDAVSDTPYSDDFTLSVDGIGRWLTASFQLSHTNAAAYIGDVRQESKVTRQRFDGPMTYTVGFPTWRRMELREYVDESIAIGYMPWGREQTVRVKWLCDEPTTEYGVPRIDIELTGYPDVPWGDTRRGGVWIGMNGKTTYENATITIDGAGIYPDLPETPMLIKGRGNSTWSGSASSKNPYHFKFETKQKPLGMTNGKHWILLSNKQSGSMTSNALGHKVSQLMGVRNPIHIIPVELYVQGSYRGSYNLCERVGFGNNNVDILDETYAAMVELDSYTDETIYHDDYFYLPAKMKDPDFDADYTGLLTPQDVMADWNNLIEKIFNTSRGYADDFMPYLDRDAITSYLSTCELNMHCELKHPKSVFFYTENVTDGFDIDAERDPTSWVAGPYWDCDWNFGYEQRKTYFETSQTEDFYTSYNIGGGDSGNNAYNFWTTLRNNAEVDKAYYYLWHDFMENRLQELLDYCDEYYEFAQKSFQHNRNTEASETDYTDYAQQAEMSKEWFRQRANYIYGNLKTYPLPETPVEPEPEYPEPDDALVGIGHIGTDTDIDATAGSNSQRYDLLGRRIISQSNGITIVDGRKVMQ